MTALKALFDRSASPIARSVRPTSSAAPATPRSCSGECVSGAAGAWRNRWPTSRSRAGLSLAVGPRRRHAGRRSLCARRDPAYLLLGRDPRPGARRTSCSRPRSLAARSPRCSAARGPPNMTEPIRGLLADDPRERWTLDDLDGWAERAARDGAAVATPRRAARPFELGGTPMSRRARWPDAFTRDPAAAEKPIRSGEFEAWLQRSLGESERIAAVALAVAEAGGRNAGARGAARRARRDRARSGGAGALWRFRRRDRRVRAGAGRDVSRRAAARRRRRRDPWRACRNSGSPSARRLRRSRRRCSRASTGCVMLLEDRRPDFGLERSRSTSSIPAFIACRPRSRMDYVIDARICSGAGARRGRRPARRTAGRPPSSPPSSPRACAHGRQADWHRRCSPAPKPDVRALGSLKVLARSRKAYGAEAVRRARPSGWAARCRR